MAILIGAGTRVLCQGLGRAGSFHLKGCLEYGTRVVAGVQPGKGGGRVEGLPVFDRVAEAARATGADASMIFVPAPSAAAAILEAADAGLRIIVCITEGIPVLDMARVREALRGRPVRLIGPNCPGIITPGACKIGIMPGYIHRPGRIGVLSKSGTLTYEAVWQLTQLGLGQSTCVGVGGDPILGSSFTDLLPLFEADPGTDAVLLIGEIGGDAEREAAAYWRGAMRKPVIAFVAGRTAPPGRRMGHAGAMVSGGEDTALAKIQSLREAGMATVDSPALLGEAVRRALGK